LIADSSSEGTQIPRLIIDYILIPSSEGARIAALNLIVEFTIVFELAGYCPARIIFRNTPHKIIGKHFIVSTYSIGFQLRFPRGGAAPFIYYNISHWLIVENTLPGARVIREEPHGLIVMSNAPHNFEQDLALGNKASFDTSNIFGPNSNLIVDLILSTAGAQITASKLIVMCAFGLNELIKLMLASHY
jgi:hypothetical protein